MAITAGQFLINNALPKDLQDKNRVMDKKSLNHVLNEVAKKYPKDYPSIVYNLKKIGQESAYLNGSSFTLDDFKTPINKDKIFRQAEERIAKRTLGKKSEKEKEKIFVEEYFKAKQKIEKDVFEESLRRGNTLAHMVNSGSRGNKSQLNSTIGAATLYTDHLNRPILSPVKKSFSEGLTPREYIASTPGTRKGVVATKFATPMGGFFNKQMGYVTGNIIVSADDCGTNNGIEEPALDPYNIGRVLSRSIAGVPAGTVIDNRIMSMFKKKRVDKIFIRSPLSCESDAGICKKCRGYTENGSFASLGDNVGINSSSALTEPFTQGAMKEKHTGGTMSKLNAVGGFDLIRQLVKIPRVFKGGAAISNVDGVVSKIEKAPQGGNNIFVGEEKHYAPDGFPLTVKEGDVIEAGEPLSLGIVNPSKVTKHRGIGEGRMSLYRSLRNAYVDDGKNIDKVHMETVARGLVNNVKIKDIGEMSSHIPGDIVTYTSANRHYDPKRTMDIGTKNAAGKYLAKPYLHFTAGTKLKKKMTDYLNKKGVGTLRVTDTPPPFVPHMVRLDDSPSYKENWIARLFSDKIQSKLLNALHRGEKARIHSEEFIPSYIEGKDFGKIQIGY